MVQRFPFLVLWITLAATQAQAQTYLPGPAPSVGPMVHVADTMGGRSADRTMIGMGETLTCSIDMSTWSDPDIELIESGQEPVYDQLGVVYWSASGGATAFPCVGPSVTITATPAFQSYTAVVSAQVLDAGLYAKDEQAAQTTVALNIEKPSGVKVTFVEDLSRKLPTYDPNDATIVELIHRLLEDEPTRMGRAEICAAACVLHVQAGMLHPERVSSYCEQAIVNGIDPETATRLLVYSGDAEQIQAARTRDRSRLKRAADLYVRAIERLSNLDIPETPPAVPIMDVEHSLNTARDIELNGKRYAERQKYVDAGRLVELRRAVYKQLADLASRLSMAELNDASQLLSDQNTRQELRQRMLALGVIMEEKNAGPSTVGQASVPVPNNSDHQPPAMDRFLVTMFAANIFICAIFILVFIGWKRRKAMHNGKQRV